MYKNTRFTLGLTLASVLSLIINPIAAISASAQTGISVQSTPLFAESFLGSTLGDPNNWVLSKGSSSAAPCLTARDSDDGVINLSGGTSINGCSSTPIDPAGSGALRLTNTSQSQSGSLQYVNPISTANGLDIQFKIAEYGSGYAGDGIGFFLRDGSVLQTNVGGTGGALGYTPGANIPGVKGGLIGIGFDKFGNFAAPNFQPNAVTVRGADDSVAKDGTGSFTILGGTGSNGVSYAGTNRTEAARTVRIAIDPSTAEVPKVKIYFSDATGTLPTTPTVEVDPPAQYLTASTFTFGFAASTGGATNYHEIWDLGISPATPDTQPRMRCAGGGWYGGPKRSRGSFQFQVTQDKNGVYGGAVSYMLKGSSGNQDTDTRFKGQLTECRGNETTNIATGTGELFIRSGPGWQSLGNQTITITFTPTDKRGKKVIPGTINFSTSPYTLSSGGDLGGGEVKVY